VGGQIVVPARLGDCPVLLSEDMQHGLDVNGTRIVNPFMLDAPSPGQSILATVINRFLRSPLPPGEGYRVRGSKKGDCDRAWYP
jgi:hypothetical protein